jgi:hypothetical protein
MKDEKYPDAVIICPASDVGEDEFQSKKSLPAKTFDRETLFLLFHTTGDCFERKSAALAMTFNTLAVSRPHPSPRR